MTSVLTEDDNEMAVWTESSDEGYLHEIVLNTRPIGVKILYDKDTMLAVHGIIIVEDIFYKKQKISKGIV